LFELQAVQETIGIQFQDGRILQQAFLHSSYINENPGFASGDNERLEFLGDALLSFIVAEELYDRFPDFGEGKLTQIRASLIRQETLVDIAMDLGLGNYLLLGRGEESTGGRQKQTNLADSLESLIGAIYLDQGFDTVKKFVLDKLAGKFEQINIDGIGQNYKALLQELTQAKHKLLPSYNVEETSGPDHDRRFVVRVTLGDKSLASGSGKTKKAAEMEAARLALEKVNSK
jgi:ribonuclease-3